MKLKQCLNRHFYDEDVFETCPFCDSKTPLEIDAKQVVGIVKCVFGNSKGKQYMLHKGVNRVGSSYQMDVRIENDLQVTYDNHCSIIYDETKKRFSILPSAGTVTYFNNELLKRKRILKKEDVFRIGRSDYKVLVLPED